MECDPKLLAEELVRRNNINYWERIEFLFEKSKKCRLKIFLRRAPKGYEKPGYWVFVNNHVGWVRPIEENVIQKKICDKASKLSNYKGKYRHVILLIVTDRGSDSGMFHCDQKTLVLSNCGFLSVYLGSYPEKIRKLA